MTDLDTRTEERKAALDAVCEAREAAIAAVCEARKALSDAEEAHETALLKWHAAMNADLITIKATP